MNTFLAGEKVRINAPGEYEHGSVVTVIGSSVSRIDERISYWVKMPFGDYVWLYRPHELTEIPNDHIRYVIAVGNGIALGVVFTARELAEEAAKNLRLKYYEVIPERVTKTA